MSGSPGLAISGAEAAELQRPDCDGRSSLPVAPKSPIGPPGWRSYALQDPRYAKLRLPKKHVSGPNWWRNCNSKRMTSGSSRHRHGNFFLHALVRSHVQSVGLLPNLDKDTAPEGEADKDQESGVRELHRTIPSTKASLLAVTGRTH